MKWNRDNLNKYIEDDRLKWKYADKNHDTNLTREEYEFFHHPLEHEAMGEYIALVRYKQIYREYENENYLRWLRMVLIV